MVKLSNRLRACASLVRDGASLADVGCDHGLIPVYLAQNKKIKSAVACDINKKPLIACENLVKSQNLEDKIKCVLSDGLSNINEFEVTDILIAGMGGELIAGILSKCSWLKEKHLILNPMTHAEKARKWLFDNGFYINNDFIVKEGRHHYCVLDAYFSNEHISYTETDCYLGKINDFSDKEYFNHLLNYLNARQLGGEDNSQVILAIKEKINDLH